MASEILRPQNSDSTPAPSTEVEFALVISRMIDSAKGDPEYLRSAVYELARHKLKEQFGSDKSVDFSGLSKSLETAIQGVETFKSKNQNQDLAALPSPDDGRQGRMLPAPHAEGSARSAVPIIEVVSETRDAKFAVLWRLVAVMVIGAAVVFAFRQQGLTIEVLRDQVNRIAAVQTRPGSVPQVQPTKADGAIREPPQPSPLTPTAYGIYAISQEKLYELEMLPGKVPDMRVAVSAAIATPSKTSLPDGHLRFVVYRRDSATNAVDRAEVRLVAKVAQETTFNPAGKAVLAKVDDTWVIRNISIPFRTAPSKDSPDMYEVQREDTEGGLAPGRYVLVIKGQAYDFSVAGEIADQRQCLERLSASNGQFYSECHK